jgi:hypothetical protein
MYINEDASWEFNGSLELIEKADALHDDGPIATIADLGALKAKETWPESWSWFDGLCPHSKEVLLVAKSGDYLADIQTLDVRYLKKTSAEINWEKRQLNADKPKLN